MVKEVYYARKTINKDKLTVHIDEKGEYKSKKKHKHDITLRKILMNKKEAAILINTALKLNNSKNKIIPQNIELCNNRFITKSYYNKETDIIYKIKDKDIYFLIEHQSTVDYNMAKRILQYKVEIIEEFTRGRKINSRKYKIPLVEAIVIYTGKRKWDVEESIEKVQEKLEGIESKGIRRIYNNRHK